MVGIPDKDPPQSPSSAQALPRSLCPPEGRARARLPRRFQCMAPSFFVPPVFLKWTHDTPHPTTFPAVSYLSTMCSSADLTFLHSIPNGNPTAAQFFQDPNNYFLINFAPLPPPTRYNCLHFIPSENRSPGIG